MLDIPGNLSFKSRLSNQFLPGAHAVIILVDSKDKEKISEAADILYDVINDIDLAMAGVPVMVACNKQDLTFAKRAIQLERDLQIEIEQIRKVKRAAREQEQDNSTALSHTANKGAKTGISTPMGYLESLKGKF